MCLLWTSFLLIKLHNNCIYHAKRGSLVSLEQCLSNSDIPLSTCNICFMCEWLAYYVDAYHEDNQSVGSLIVSEPALNVIYRTYLNLVKVIISIHSVNIDNNVMLRRNSTSQYYLLVLLWEDSHELAVAWTIMKLDSMLEIRCEIVDGITEPVLGYSSGNSNKMRIFTRFTEHNSRPLSSKWTS